MISQEKYQELKKDITKATGEELDQLLEIECGKEIEIPLKVVCSFGTRIEEIKGKLNLGYWEEVKNIKFEEEGKDASKNIYTIITTTEKIRRAHCSGGRWFLFFGQWRVTK